MKILVIGGGPAGYVSAIRAAQLGAEVILVEKNELGGTCLNRGCVPTKSLLSDLKLILAAKKMGIAKSESKESFDILQTIMDRKVDCIRYTIQGVRKLLESHKINIINDEADFISPKKVILKGQKNKKSIISPDKVILTPGSKPKYLHSIRSDGERIITSDEALNIKIIPSQITIIGAGYIGVEFACIYNMLGSKVNVVEIDEQILPGIDTEISKYLLRYLTQQGITLYTGSKVKDIDDTGEIMKLIIETNKILKTLDSETILLSVGREPNLGNINYDKANIDINQGGIKVNEYLETTNNNIFAAGDAVGGPLLAYVASEQGVIAADNAMGNKRTSVIQTIPVCIFSSPEISSVGLSENEARKKNYISVGRFPFRSNPKAIILGATDGMIKVITNRDDSTILGIHIIGCDADSLISAASIIVNQKLKIRDAVEVLQVHPSSGEAMREAFMDINKTAIHMPKIIFKTRGMLQK